jgi:hypothetical protein
MRLSGALARVCAPAELGMVPSVNTASAIARTAITP